MKRYWFGLIISMFFYTKIDILIWQRIFEANAIWDIGLGSYHWGWFQALIGFLILGTFACYPNIRRMILFPISLTLLAFSGWEDILYYWLDGKAVPVRLPWLQANFLILHPVTSGSIFLSAGFWLAVVLILYAAGAYLEKKIKSERSRKEPDPLATKGLTARQPTEVEQAR